MSRSLTFLLVVLLVGVSARAGLGAERERSTGAGSSQGVPELPRILSARVVLGTKYGTAVRVSYCFRSLSRDPSTRPWRLHLTVENLKDDLPPLSLGWEVTKRCDIVVHPVGGIQQPYLLRYSVESRRGTWSKQANMRLKELPELNRAPALPSISARVVTGTNGRAVRISYCFRSLPSDASRRPWRLWVTIVNAETDLRQAAALGQTKGGPTSVTRRCDTVTFPVAGIEPPYRLLYSVESRNGTRSKRAEIAVR